MYLCVETAVELWILDEVLLQIAAVSQNNHNEVT